MKLMQQEKEFSPVAIVLETEDDFNLMWDIIMRCMSCEPDQKVYGFAAKIDDYFRDEVKL